MGETKKEITSRLKSIESKVDEILNKIESTQNQNEGTKMGRIEKTLYFKRQELEDWILSGRRKTISELVDS